MSDFAAAIEKLSRQVADPGHVYAISAEQAAAILEALGIALPPTAPEKHDAG